MGKYLYSFENLDDALLMAGSPIFKPTRNVKIIKKDKIFGIVGANDPGFHKDDIVPESKYLIKDILTLTDQKTVFDVASFIKERFNRWKKMFFGRFDVETDPRLRRLEIKLTFPKLVAEEFYDYLYTLGDDILMSSKNHVEYCWNPQKFALREIFDSLKERAEI